MADEQDEDPPDLIDPEEAAERGALAEGAEVRLANQWVEAGWAGTQAAKLPSFFEASADMVQLIPKPKSSTVGLDTVSGSFDTDGGPSSPSRRRCPDRATCASERPAATRAIAPPER